MIVPHSRANKKRVITDAFFYWRFLLVLCELNGQYFPRLQRRR